jgi:phospho-N-acetylmuramoyl-pentapeptide-transferase
MFYRLLYPLHESLGAFNVFRYATFRSALAAFTALVLALVLGPWLIDRLRQFQIGQEIREEGPASHQAKAGTPTMGGLLIITAIVVPTLMWTNLANPLVWIGVGSVVLFGGIGFLDDYLKITKKRSLGLRAGAKFGLQLALGAGIGIVLLVLSRHGLWETHLQVPFLKTFRPELGWLYVPFAMLVIVGSANAVNLTDGLDGLAIGSTLIASGTFAILTYAAGNAKVAQYLGIAGIKGADDLAVLCLAMVGASLGFLWFNCHPAQIFMGDVGSMALGGGLGTVAVLIKQELLLVLVGGLFVIEAASVILQVASFKTRGVRIFRMSPIHHHFELSGWHESKIVIRFWILALIFALLSLATLKLR